MHLNQKNQIYLHDFSLTSLDKSPSYLPPQNSYLLYPILIYQIKEQSTSFLDYTNMLSMKSDKEKGTKINLVSKNKHKADKMKKPPTTHWKTRNFNNSDKMHTTWSIPSNTNNQVKILLVFF